MWERKNSLYVRLRRRAGVDGSGGSRKIDGGKKVKQKSFALCMIVAALCAVVLLQTRSGSTQSSAFRARDPGVRGGAAGAGEPINGLSGNQPAFFEAGKEDFEEVEEVADGLGPTLNLDGCSTCHIQPAVGGTSPFVNPQVAFANKNGANNRIPPFISANGPVREARFVRNPDGTPDGGVHALFTIAGRSDAPGCRLSQPDFATALAKRNVIFRIPTPVFGAGLIEQIPDKVILANQTANVTQKNSLGIRGRPNFVLAGSTLSGQPNNNGNDGTIARFGWKAQNKSLLLFSGEAYNVEMGITNELFQTERNETAGCQFAETPNDVTNTEATTLTDAISAIEKFAFFMRFLAPPSPSPNNPGGAQSIASGKAIFASVGCALCHTPTLRTGKSTVAALSEKDVNLYSDLLLHDMGPELADGVSQGQAGPREFRTAPLWGLGQRIFFLHDGRTKDLIEAINAHKSGSNRDASEANGVIGKFNNLTESQQQDLLNFLRSL
jgi:CxxC motif-containing protein (DUF1111 family)